MVLCARPGVGRLDQARVHQEYAEQSSADFTVYRYDRRGRGDSVSADALVPVVRKVAGSMINGYGLVCLWGFGRTRRRLYVGKLGFDVTFQQEMNGAHWLLVNPRGAPELPHALNVPDPPVMDEETAADVRKLVSIGYAGGPGAFKTDD